MFIDSEEETWNMDPELLRQAYVDYINKGKKPKAIIPVHLYGMPAKMNEILAIAKEFNIPVIEDAAEALGSTYQDTACGTLGSYGVLSFNGNKIITTSGGGALISDNKEVIDRARFLATQARDSAPHYEHSNIGYNYRMSNICAGIGRGQMQVLSERVQQRRTNYAYYRDNLSGLPGLTFVDEPEGSYSNRWLTTVLIHPDVTGGISRESVRLALETENIESRPLWKPMHLQPVFARAVCYGGDVARQLFDKGLCLPSGSNLLPEQLEEIVSIIRHILN